MLSARRVGGRARLQLVQVALTWSDSGASVRMRGSSPAEGDTPRETLTCRSPATCNGDAAIAAVTFSLR